MVTFIDCEEWYQQQRYDVPEQYGTITRYRLDDGSILFVQETTQPTDWFDPMNGELEIPAGTRKMEWVERAAAPPATDEGGK